MKCAGGLFVLIEGMGINVERGGGLAMTEDARYLGRACEDVQALGQQRIHHKVQRRERPTHQRLSVDGQQSVFFFQFHFLRIKG